MNVERRLAEALRSADSFQPSPDLFARVKRSVEEDRIHRRRVLGVVALSVLFVTTLTLWVASFTRLNILGTRIVPQWTLEVAETAVLIAILISLGPSIRRFGQNYISDIFRAVSHATMLRLLDIAYYLVFTGWILDSVELSNGASPIRLALGVEESAVRIGSFLVAMGVLHVITLYALPIVGLIATNSRWRWQRSLLGPNAPTPAPDVVRIDTLIRTGIRVLFVLVALFVAAQVIGLLIAGAGELSR